MTRTNNTHLHGGYSHDPKINEGVTLSVGIPYMGLAVSIHVTVTDEVIPRLNWPHANHISYWQLWPIRILALCVPGPAILPNTHELEDLAHTAYLQCLTR